MATTQSTHGSVRRGGEQITNEARNLIEENIGRENLEVVFGALQSFGDVCMRGIRQTTTYIRRHPVQFSVGVVALGLLGSWLAKSKAKETLH